MNLIYNPMDLKESGAFLINTECYSVICIRLNQIQCEQHSSLHHAHLTCTCLLVKNILMLLWAPSFTHSAHSHDREIKQIKNILPSGVTTFPIVYFVHSLYVQWLEWNSPPGPCSSVPSSSQTRKESIGHWKWKWSSSHSSMAYGLVSRW